MSIYSSCGLLLALQETDAKDATPGYDHLEKLDTHCETNSMPKEEEEKEEKGEEVKEEEEKEEEKEEETENKKEEVISGEEVDGQMREISGV